MNNALKGCLGIIGAVMVLATCGAVMDGVDTKAKQATPPQLTPTVRYVPTVTVVKQAVIATPTEQECKALFQRDITSVLDHWRQVRSLLALDAVISEYDTAVALPYGCSDNDTLLDEIDTTVRIGLAQHRTSFMTKPAKAELHLNASYEAQMRAESMVREYMR